MSDDLYTLMWWRKRKRRCSDCDSWRLLAGFYGIYVCPHCDSEAACCAMTYKAYVTYVPPEWSDQLNS